MLCSKERFFRSFAPCYHARTCTPCAPPAPALPSLNLVAIPVVFHQATATFKRDGMQAGSGDRAMPHRMTRPQAAKRLAIRAYLDACPGTSYKALAGLFRASYSAVRDATRFTVVEWAEKVADAPPGPSPPRHPAARSSPRGLATGSPLPRDMPPRAPGTATTARIRAKRDAEPGDGGDVDVPEAVDFDQDETIKDLDIPEPVDLDLDELTKDIDVPGPDGLDTDEPGEERGEKASRRYRAG